MKMISTVSGIDMAKVGSSATDIRNQLYWTNSLPSNGRPSALPVSRHILKKPPMACNGPRARLRRYPPTPVVAVTRNLPGPSSK